MEYRYCSLNTKLVLICLRIANKLSYTAVKQVYLGPSWFGHISSASDESLLKTTHNIAVDGKKTNRKAEKDVEKMCVRGHEASWSAGRGDVGQNKMEENH